MHLEAIEKKTRRLIAAIMIPALLLICPAMSEAREAKLKRFTLSNGLEVLALPDHTRKVTSIQLWAKVGSGDETKSEKGISHLIEHMAFKGTKRRGVGEIAKEVEALGGQTNAYTSWDETVFHVTVPSHATAQGLDILSDAVLNPTIDPGELEKEKQVVLEEILEGEERPGKKGFKLLFETAYVKSPYRYPVIGFKDTVESFTRDDIIAFRKKWYVPENMFLVIAGDVDPDKLRPDIERMLGGFKANGFFRPPRPTEPTQTEIRSSLERDKNTRESRLYLAFHVPALKGVDVNALDLAANILGSRDSSRLVRILKKEKQLVNEVQAYCLTPKKPGLFIVMATLEAKNLAPATKAIMDEIARLSKEPPSDSELERAKVDIESEHVYGRETVDGLARSLGSFKAGLGDAQYEEKYLALNRAVPKENVSRAVTQYLVPPNVTVSALIPENSDKEFKMDRLTKIIQEYAPAKSAVASAEAESGVVTRTLDNGVRVVLMPDDTNPVISFRIALLGGKRFETKETEGIANLIAQMIDKGAGGMSEMDISRKVEDMGGRLKGFSGYDSFGVSASFFSRYGDEGLGLLKTIYSEPGFPEDKLERERALVINRIKTEPDRPIPYAMKELDETLFPKHPYGFDKEGTLSTVARFSRADLVDTYKRLAVPANTVIAGVGKMDVEKTLRRITDLFGAIPSAKFDKPEVPTEEPLTTVREKVVRIPRAKAHVMVGFHAVSLKEEDRYPLSVLNNVLAGQGGRLFLELRDKQSLAYIVTSFFRPGLDPGKFAFYIATEPSKVDQAVKGVFKEIDRVRKELIPKEELQNAITNVVGVHQISLQSTWSRAENNGLNTLYGLGYDYDKEFVKKIRAVTPEQTLAAAKKYLDPKRCVVVKILPEDN